MDRYRGVDTSNVCCVCVCACVCACMCVSVTACMRTYVCVHVLWPAGDQLHVCSTLLHAVHLYNIRIYI